MSTEMTPSVSPLAYLDDQPGIQSSPVLATAAEKSPAGIGGTTSGGAAPVAAATNPGPGGPLEPELASSPVQDGPPQQGGSPLAEFGKALAGIIAEAQYQEMWGVDLTNIRDPPTCIVLQKFLRANNNNYLQAHEQLQKALIWRKEFRPLDVLQEEHSREKFAGLGYVTRHSPPSDLDDTPPTIITWNIYGGVKNKKATFTNIDEFCRWRVALMELGIQGLKIKEATAPIPDGEEDTYRMIQVHDYLDVSFLRLDPEIKAASKKVIDIFSTAYPELLEHKYFVNVPYVMNWIFNFFKMFMAKETIAKFHPMAKGTMLANELPIIADTLPGVYGGRGVDLMDDKTAIIPHMTEDLVGEEVNVCAETEGPSKNSANSNDGENQVIGKDNEAPAPKDAA